MLCTYIPTLIDPRAISTRAGVNSRWEWNFRMDPSGPGAVPGTRHSWLAPLVTQPGMPPGPFGAIWKSFIPTLIDPRANSMWAGVNSGWEWDFRMDPFGPWAVPGTRHSWLAPLVTRPGMPPGPFGAIRKSFIPAFFDSKILLIFQLIYLSPLS